MDPHYERFAFRCSTRPYSARRDPHERRRRRIHRLKWQRVEEGVEREAHGVCDGVVVIQRTIVSLSRILKISSAPAHWPLGRRRTSTHVRQRSRRRAVREDPRKDSRSSASRAMTTSAATITLQATAMTLVCDSIMSAASYENHTRRRAKPIGLKTNDRPSRTERLVVPMRPSTIGRRPWGRKSNTSRART